MVWQSSCLVSILLLLNLHRVHAQEAYPLRESPYTPGTHEKLHWGIRAGMNVTIPHFDGGTPAHLEPVPGLGWSVAGMALLKLTPRWSLLGEAGYNRRVYHVTSDSVVSGNKMSLSMLDATIQLRRRFPIRSRSGATSELFVGFGPSLGYWMGGSGTIEAPGNSLSYQVRLNENPDPASSNLMLNGVNQWQAGITAGIGFDVPIYNQKLFLELRGTLGLTPLGSSGYSSSLNFPGYETSPLSYHILNPTLWTLSANASYTFVYNPMTSKLGKSTRAEKRKQEKAARKKEKSYLNTRIKVPKKSPQQ